MKKQIKLLIVALLFGLLQACGGNDSASGSMAKMDASSPDGALMAVVQSLKSNDIKALMQSSMSSADYDKVVQEFEKAKMSPSESDKAKYLQMMGMLTSDGAVENLMAMAAPQLEQARSQLPMLLMMGKGMAPQAIQSNPDFSTDQKESLTKAANAFFAFASENDFLSEEVTRKAITIAVDTAKNLNMSSLDELQNMSFDQATDKASLVMGGFKNIVGVYGISVDDLLGSIDVSDVVENGDSASMKLAYKFLGESIVQDVKMVKKDGKWTASK